GLPGGSRPSRAPSRSMKRSMWSSRKPLAGSIPAPSIVIPVFLLIAAQGHLFIVGGGSQSDSLVARFVELAGGRGRARIAVVPMASGDAQSSGDEKAAQLREFGADAFVLLVTRAQAESASTAQ